MFRHSGLRVEDLAEPLVPADAPIPGHLDEPTWRAWVTRWPFDCVWTARKAG